jgi:hypothetical protein
MVPEDSKPEQALNQAPLDIEAKRPGPWWSKPAAGIVALVVVIGVAGFLVLRPHHYHVTGVLAAPACAGGYDIENSSVQITNERGEIIGTTQTGSDTLNTATGCEVAFDLTVPKAKFYDVTIGTHKGPSYSFAQMQQMGWKLTLSLSGG